MLSKVLDTQPPCACRDLSHGRAHDFPECFSGFLSPLSQSCFCYSAAISDGKLVYYFQKAPIIFVSALFSSIYSQLPSQLNYLVTGIFGLLLIGMTSSSARTSSSYLNSATESAVFLKFFGVRINFGKCTPSSVDKIKFLRLKCTRTDIIVPDGKWFESK